MAGNARFVANKSEPHDHTAKVIATATGQYPFAAVLACMDSRAPIEIVFDQGIGDVFGVRVAGNVVNDDELGSLEYAAKVGAKLIVVLGHTRCGAVKGALDGVQLGNLTGLLDKIHPAIDAAHCTDSHSDQCVDSVAEAERAAFAAGDSRAQPVPGEVPGRGEARAGRRHLRRGDRQGALDRVLTVR